MDEGEEARVRRTAEAGEAGSGRVILNTRELTEQIHLPTPPFFLSLLPLLRLQTTHLHLAARLLPPPVICSYPISPPTPLISVKSS